MVLLGMQESAFGSSSSSDHDHDPNRHDQDRVVNEATGLLSHTPTGKTQDNVLGSSPR